MFFLCFCCMLRTIGNGMTCLFVSRTKMSYSDRKVTKVLIKGRHCRGRMTKWFISSIRSFNCSVDAKHHCSLRLSKDDKKLLKHSCSKLFSCSCCPKKTFKSIKSHVFEMEDLSVDREIQTLDVTAGIPSQSPLMISSKWISSQVMRDHYFSVSNFFYTPVT